MLRILMFLLGFGLSIIGFMYIIMYLNYLEIGYSFKDYINLITSSFECYLAFLGLIIISITIFIKGEKHDIYL